MASWASTTQNWAGAGFTWADGEYNLNVTAIFNAGLGYTETESHDIVETILLNQASSSTGTGIDPADSSQASLSGSYEVISTASLIMKEEMILGLGGSVLNNTEYPEGVTFGTVLTANADGTFLWTEIEEDTSEWTVVKKSG